MNDERVSLKKRTALLSVLSNTFLIIVKLVVGVMTGAVSIVSEAAHSAVDLLAALIALYAVRKSDEPPDAHHAYGHGKFESLSGAAEAALIVLAAIWILAEAGKKLFVPEPPEYIELGIAVMLASVVINYLVSARLLKVAAATGSQALEADALHLRADIWTSAGVMAGLALIKLTGQYWLDPAVAVVVAGIVFKAGWGMTKRSLYELTDISLPADEEALIRDIVGSHPDVIEFHQLRTRRSGSRRLIDMHLILYKNMHLDKAHQVADQLEADIKERLGDCDIVIHLEPCDHQEESACPCAENQLHSSCGAAREKVQKGE